MNSCANQASPKEGGIPVLFNIRRRWPAASDPQRLPARQGKEECRQTLRMSLALAAAGRCSVAQQRARDARQRPVRMTQSVLDDLITFAVRPVIAPANKADGAARTGRLSSVGRLWCPAAHPQRSAK